MTKQLKLSALIVAMVASTAAFADGVVPDASWTGSRKVPTTVTPPALLLSPVLVKLW
nr:hypothetical protein [Snodgrassella sp. CFCC 13594]